VVDIAGGCRRIGVGNPHGGYKGGEFSMQFTDTASAGNGGVATSSANGGAVSLGNVSTAAAMRGTPSASVTPGDRSWQTAAT
jgi:hypothetical protein